MYILKNALILLKRNKGRNLLIMLVIIVIGAASTTGLSIYNTANRLVESYRDSNDLTATLSFNRENLTSQFTGGTDSQKDNIEAFNDIETISLEDVKSYGDSDLLKGYYYTYSTSLDSDTLTKASDSYSWEEERSETTTESNSTTTPGNGGNFQMPPGFQGDTTTINNNTTTIITKEQFTMNSNMALTGDFTLNGYSSYDAMSEFVDGTYTVTDGTMITSFDSDTLECVISQELATLNEISVGDTIELKNSNTDTTYTFTVVGIYEASSSEDNTFSMYSKVANELIVSSAVVEKLASEDEDLTTNVTPTFILKDEDSIEAFQEEVTSKGLSEYYTVSTNLEDLENATKTIENVKSFAGMFILITFGVAVVVLFVINMINIRERKYEIGVFRTIGMSKSKLCMQFMFEILVVTVLALGIGAVVGANVSTKVGNMLLASEVEEATSQESEIASNFGMSFDPGNMPGGQGGPGGMNFNFNSSNVKQVTLIDSMDAIVDTKVVAELVGIGLLLVVFSSMSSMIAIQRFSPLTILKERS